MCTLNNALIDINKKVWQKLFQEKDKLYNYFFFYKIFYALQYLIHN